MNQAQWVLIETGAGDLKRLRCAIEEAGRKVTVLSMGAVYENRDIPALENAVVYGQQGAVRTRNCCVWMAFVDQPRGAAVQNLLPAVPPAFAQFAIHPRPTRRACAQLEVSCSRVFRQGRRAFRSPQRQQQNLHRGADERSRCATTLARLGSQDCCHRIFPQDDTSRMALLHPREKLPDGHHVSRQRRRPTLGGRSRRCARVRQLHGDLSPPWAVAGLG